MNWNLPPFSFPAVLLSFWHRCVPADLQGLGQKPRVLSLLQACTSQVSCLQYHSPEVFRTIMGNAITRTQRFVFHLTASCLPSLSASRSGWFLCSCLAPSVQPFYFRAPFHLMLACSQLCTFWLRSSSEVISCCRSCSPLARTWVPWGGLRPDCWLWKVLYPGLAEEITGVQTFTLGNTIMLQLDLSKWKQKCFGSAWKLEASTRPPAMLHPLPVC